MVETYLTGGIYDITLEVGSLMGYFLGEGVLDGGVVGVDEVFFNELVYERGLALKLASIRYH